MQTHQFIVILGPTASGKTSLGVKLAKRFNGVVFSADSRQTYHGLNAGTAKIKRAEMQDVPHYLLDIASPKRVFTVAQFQKAAQAVLQRIPTTTPIFVVGGSPFYIEAIINPVPFPAVPPNPKLRKQLAKKTTAQLFVLLKRRDPKRAANIDQANPVRLIRALEIVAALGAVPARPKAKLTNVLKLGLNPARAQLYRQIDRRVDRRIPGIVSEIKRLRKQGVSWKRLDELGLEYRWIGRYVRGQINRTTAVERLKGDIHGFARRQLTWWRRDSKIRWMTSEQKAKQLTRNFLHR